MDKYVIFDLETIGLGRSAEIIEIAALKVVDGSIIDTFESFVKPTVPIPASVQALTHITNDMVTYAPYIDEILPAFLYFIEENRLVGHNITTFDLPIIRRLISEIPDMIFDNNYDDTLYMARRKLDLPNYKLSTVAAQLNIDTINAHRALKDCYITFECYQKLKTLPDLKNRTAHVHKNTSKNIYTSKISEKTKALQTLNGFIMGIIADDMLTDDEILSLNKWIETHIDLTGQYPFDRIFKALNTVLADGKIDEYERQQLLDYFNEVINPIENTASCGDICFSGKYVCLTGEFDYGEKATVAATIATLGGIIEKNVKRNLDYLIVGNRGSEAWTNENYGGKVKKAMEYNDKGCHITILKEKDLNL